MSVKASEIGPKAGKNHYGAPCACCGKRVAAFKGGLFESRDGLGFVVLHSCCDAVMAMLRSATSSDLARMSNR